MADNTPIEWTDATWNPITGCSMVSPGCTNCYAMRLAGTRLQHHPSRAGLTTDTKAGPVWNGQVRFNPEWLDQPLRWKRPRQIFVCAHGDLFHEEVPDEWIDRVFAIMALAPQHTFQVLTKRADRMRFYLSSPKLRDDVLRAASLSMPISWAVERRMGLLPLPLPNVWLGVSAEDQKRADERIPDLLATPAAVRWVSAEPLLGPVDLTRLRPDITMKVNALTGHAEHMLGFRDKLAGLDWVVAGGESGPGARPMHPAWARSLRDQCADAGVAFHFKQHGAWISAHDAGYANWNRVGQAADGTILGEVGDFRGGGTPGLAGRTWPSSWPFGTAHDPGPVMIRVGKTAAGRQLDGIEHNGIPTTQENRS